MRRRAIMILLGMGVLFGYGSGCAAFHRHCRAHRAAWAGWRYEAPCGPTGPAGRWARPPAPPPPVGDAAGPRG